MLRKYAPGEKVPKTGTYTVHSKLRDDKPHNIRSIHLVEGDTFPSLQTYGEVIHWTLKEEETMYTRTAFVQEFTHDDQLIFRVQKLREEGVDAGDLYVLSHDEERTRRLADQAGVNVIGISEMGFVNTIENFFNEKGDKLRNQLKGMGFNEAESESLEQKLDQGKILLFIKDQEDPTIV